MTVEKFEEHLEDVFSRTRKVLLQKRNEYAGDKDVFNNFNNATGISLHKTNTSVGWEYCVKHLQSIKDLIQEVENGNRNNLTTSRINEKFGDVINYFILLEGMLKEK